MLGSVLSYIRDACTDRSESRLSRAGRAICHLFRNLPRQLEILYVFGRPLFARLRQQHPHILWKYIRKDYLARNLTVSQRAACHAHHYHFLLSRFSRSFLQDVLTQGVVLYRTNRLGADFSMVLSLADQGLEEGELAIDFIVDGRTFYNVSFSIVPAPVVGMAGRSAVLVSRLQGVPNSRQQVRQAFQAFRDRPATLLLIAVEGFAKSLGLDQVIATDANNQTVLYQDHCRRLRPAYDQYFVSRGARRFQETYFYLPFPMRGRPLEEISRNNRTRARKRRSFHLTLASEVYTRVKPAVRYADTPAPALFSANRHRETTPNSASRTPAIDAGERGTCLAEAAVKQA